MCKIYSNLTDDIKTSIFVKLFFIYQVLTRLGLYIYANLQNYVGFLEIPEIFIAGFVNDLVACAYGLVLVLFFRILCKPFLKNHKFRMSASFFSFAFLNSILLLNMIGEIMFWDEFSSRYNFIAVDYLIYTQEIIGTLAESVPVIPLVLGVITTILLTIFFNIKLIYKNAQSNKTYVHLFLLSLLISTLCHFYYEPEKISFRKNNFVKELSKNGMYEFVYAFFNNELEYSKFYPVIDRTLAEQNVRNLTWQEGDEFTSNVGIERRVNGKDILKRKLDKPNYVVIVVESLSAEYLGVFGNKQNYTPYLDRLAKESIFFTKAYATGTRTVRGLEAVAKSIPPTPGASLLRRPNNENLFTISTILKPLGYNIDFVFGGYSYFDNMKYFFSNNGFEVLDRNDFLKSEISFANVWGVSDGDAFKKLEQKLDKRHAENKPFFSLFVTTSNHRPYTFPAGTIDMPQGSRGSVVRYTDYAIEKFIESAKTKPWFKDTIFVIVADHCASSAGKTKLPINKYHIPIILYAPSLIEPMEINYMVSQIDVIPTLLGLNGMSYISNFYGMDALKSAPNRAFIGTYQLLGYLKDEALVILAPNKQALLEGVGNEELEKEAISFYLNSSENLKKEQESKR